MVLSAKALSDKIKSGNACDPSGIAIVPTPNLEELENNGESSINLRLGRWFLTLRQSSETHIDADPDQRSNENKFSKRHFVPFGANFVLHPGRFVLASTLEWISLPQSCAAFVVGKSTLGRRGIIIETAAGVHPGFSGCLTLEIANVGEVPVRLIAGMLICQIFIHSIEGPLGKSDSALSGQRKPRLGQLRRDAVLQALKKSKF